MGSPEDSPAEDREPWKHFLELARQLLRFAPVFAYFFLYWYLKEKSRRLLHFGALSFLSLSLSFLLLEVFLEFFGVEAFSAFAHAHPRFAPFLLGCFALATAALLAHHQKERKRVGTEYLLIEQVWSFLEKRATTNTTKELIESSLPLIYEAFARFSPRRTCIWQLIDGRLRIQPHCAHPSQSPSFLDELERGEGVAGRVFDDHMPRYVPRLFAPFNAPSLRRFSMWFPHAIKFEIKPHSHGLVNVTSPVVSVGVVKAPPSTHLGFRSFVAVPIMSLNGSCRGVLCIDFDKTDPLERSDVKMAAILAILLSDEMERLEPPVNALVDT